MKKLSIKNAYLMFSKDASIKTLHDNKRNVNVTAFILDNELTEENKKELISKYSNIFITSNYYRYASEIVHDVICIYKKQLKNYKII